jgi:hypothetical protein
MERNEFAISGITLRATGFASMGFAGAGNAAPALTTPVFDHSVNAARL